MNSNVSVLAVIVGVMSTLVLIWKHFVEHKRNVKNDLRDDYEFTKKNIEYINSSENIPSVVIEKGYNAIAGTDELSINEIKYLLKQTQCMLKIRQFKMCKKYMYLDSDTGRIIYTKGYANTIIRSTKKILFVTSYFVLASISLYILVVCINQILGKNDFALIMLGLLLGYISILLLINGAKIEVAEFSIKRMNETAA